MAPHDGDFRSASKDTDTDTQALFSRVKIGPVTAPNRFYQPPLWDAARARHCKVEAGLLAMRAEGGWGVVCATIDIAPRQKHPDAGPSRQGHVPDVSPIAEAVHAHGGLAGAALRFDVPGSTPALAMHRSDYRALLRKHRAAAARVAAAGFDIVHLDATRASPLVQGLDLHRHPDDQRHGAYPELVRDLILDTRKATGGKCAIAVRLEGAWAPRTSDKKACTLFEQIANLPDLWEVSPPDTDIARIKALTKRPVLVTGFNDADAVRTVERGGADFFAAQRAAIADPFLPEKTARADTQSVRPCLGCPVCPADTHAPASLLCPQNPTFSMEWQTGWHPERMQQKHADASILVVGAGPAALEAARGLGERGYRVQLMGAGTEHEDTRSDLRPTSPKDALCDQLSRHIRAMPNVSLAGNTPPSAGAVRAAGAQHVILATGARWSRAGFDGKTLVPIAPREAPVFTPDDIGHHPIPDGPVVVFDSDGTETASTVVRHLRRAGHAVTLVVDGDSVAPKLGTTPARIRIRKELLACGAKVISAHTFAQFDGQTATLACLYGGPDRTVPAASVVMATVRIPHDNLYRALVDDAGGDPTALPFTLTRIGDCDSPGTLAEDVHAGHCLARNLEAHVVSDEVAPAVPFAPVRPAGPAYRTRLVETWEMALRNEAVHQALATHETDPQKRSAIARVADFHRESALHLTHLIETHGMSARAGADLSQDTPDEIEDGSNDWESLITHLRDQRHERLDALRLLQSVAPAEDIAHLALLSKGEAALVSFAERAAAGQNRPAAALDTYLRTLIQKRHAA